MLVELPEREFRWLMILVIKCLSPDIFFLEKPFSNSVIFALFCPYHSFFPLFLSFTATAISASAPLPLFGLRCLLCDCDGVCVRTLGRGRALYLGEITVQRQQQQQQCSFSQWEIEEREWLVLQGRIDKKTGCCCCCWRRTDLPALIEKWMRLKWS